MMGRLDVYAAVWGCEVMSYRLMGRGGEGFPHDGMVFKCALSQFAQPPEKEKNPNSGKVGHVCMSKKKKTTSEQESQTPSALRVSAYSSTEPEVRHIGMGSVPGDV